MQPELLRNDRWTKWHVIGAMALVALGVWATWDAWSDIFNIAMKDEESSQIWLVFPVAAWMVWVRRARVRHTRPNGTFVGPPIVLLGWLIALWGFAHNKQVPLHFGSITVVVGCLLSVLGKNVVFRFLPAFAVLIFLIPVPGMLRERIALPLQNWTAQLAQNLMEMSGVDLQRSGNLLMYNGHPILVAEACNGLRLVFPLILVTYAFTFGLPLRNGVRLVVLAISPLAAILCNVIRTVPTILVFGNCSKEFADRFHDWAGWVMLPLAFLLLLAIIKVLRWAMIPVMQYTLASQA